MAEELMDQGQLVPDELVNEMVAERLAEPDTGRGYILDGFPRTLTQAKWLDAPARRPTRQSASPRRRYQHRRRLRSAAEPHHRPPHLSRLHSSIYNIYSNPPKVAGRLRPRRHRADPAHRRHRSGLRRTHEDLRRSRPLRSSSTTAPRGRFEEVNGDQPVEAVTAAIDCRPRHHLRGSNQTATLSTRAANTLSLWPS